tara:strand:+ start:1113 stop:1739 length:627 start_codon:yes stop_codon:yes gene_type:complete
MIFAAIGNIDGNETALKCTLSAIEEMGIHTILHTGNAVVGLQGANEIMTLLEQFNVTCVQGSMDRLAVRYSRKQETLDRKLDESTRDALRWTHENMSSQNLEVIRDWRKTKQLELEGLQIFLCHGSPSNPRELLTADTPRSKLQRQREHSRADIIVCGGADEPFSMEVDGALFVSPGGLMAASGNAQFALINTEEKPWTVTMEPVSLP